jgi:hypothetical protein
MEGMRPIYHERSRLGGQRGAFRVAGESDAMSLARDGGNI